MLIDVIAKYPGQKLELLHHRFEGYTVKAIAQIDLHNREL